MLFEIFFLFFGLFILSFSNLVIGLFAIFLWLVNTLTCLRSNFIEKQRKDHHTLIKKYWDEFVKMNSAGEEGDIMHDYLFKLDIYDFLQLYKSGEEEAKIFLEKKGLKLVPRNESWKFVCFLFDPNRDLIEEKK